MDNLFLRSYTWTSIFELRRFAFSSFDMHRRWSLFATVMIDQLLASIIPDIYTCSVLRYPRPNVECLPPAPLVGPGAGEEASPARRGRAGAMPSDCSVIRNYSVLFGITLIRLLYGILVCSWAQASSTRLPSKSMLYGSYLYSIVIVYIHPS